jgi:uncharacterized protein
MTTIIQLGGVVLIATVAAQLGLSLLSAWRRFVKEKNQLDLSTEILINQLSAARQQRIANEASAYSWNGVRKFEVVKKCVEAGDICSFYLSPHDKKSIPYFKPGQYLTFELTIPGQEKKVIRCYSLSDRPGQDQFRVSIKRMTAEETKGKPGLVSNFFHQAIKEGDILDVKAPSGSFFLDDAKPSPVVLIGGGVGITPVLSMLNHIIANGVRTETWFFLGVRSGEDHPFKEYLEQVAREHDKIKLHVCYSRPGPKDQKGRDYHHAERVTIDLLKKVLPSSNFDFYVCGPGAMMSSITEGLESWGVPEKNIHFEAFGPASVKKTSANLTSAEASGAAKFAASITFSRSSKNASWNTSSGSLLELAEATGVALPSGCRAGNCGTCVVAIKEGEVSYLKDPGCTVEVGTCLTCISKPKGEKLVIDA